MTVFVTERRYRNARPHQVRDKVRVRVRVRVGIRIRIRIRVTVRVRVSDRVRVRVRVRARVSVWVTVTVGNPQKPPLLFARMQSNMTSSHAEPVRTWKRL